MMLFVSMFSYQHKKYIKMYFTGFDFHVFYVTVRNEAVCILTALFYVKMMLLSSLTKHYSVLKYFTLYYPYFTLKWWTDHLDSICLQKKIISA